GEGCRAVRYLKTYEIRTSYSLERRREYEPLRPTRCLNLHPSHNYRFSWSKSRNDIRGATAARRVVPALVESEAVPSQCCSCKQQLGRSCYQHAHKQYRNETGRSFHWECSFL